MSERENSTPALGSGKFDADAAAAAAQAALDALRLGVGYLRMFIEDGEVKVERIAPGKVFIRDTL